MQKPTKPGNHRPRRRSAEAGFGAVALILGMIGILAFGAVVMTSQAKTDLNTAQIQTQSGNIVQQIEQVRMSIRRCHGAMMRGNMNSGVPISDSFSTHKYYPGCDLNKNADANYDGIPCTTHNKPNEAALTSGLQYLVCANNGQNIFGGAEENALPPIMAGFEPWTYIKDASGVYVKTTSLTSPNFAQVWQQVKDNFHSNELTEATLDANNGEIGIYIFREFPVASSVAADPNAANAPAEEVE
jgi:hypothetical protein